jgi:Holliday junction resolvasome RuvABC ATP-dependent DNA helicase subunit
MVKKTKDPLQQETPEEEKLFTSLRAGSWSEFHGQENVKTALKIAIEAARKRKEAIEHILFYGPYRCTGDGREYPHYLRSCSRPLRRSGSNTYKS